MFAIEIEFLTGRYAATEFTDRDGAEWPPHPARLFSALVAEWAVRDADPEERAALEWFEALAPPQIACSDADQRAVVTHYVPVNDVTVLRDARSLYERLVEARHAVTTAGADQRTAAAADRALRRVEAKAEADSRKLSAARATTGTVDAAVALLPESRGRQARTYPTSLPADPKVYFMWPDVQESVHAEVLDRLLARVARLGHSSSMVSCRVVAEPPPPAFIPGGDALALRTTVPGLLAQLEREYARHEGSEPRTLPAQITPYGDGAAEAPPPRPHLGGEWHVLALPKSWRPPPTWAAELSRRVRDALLSHADEPIPEVLSGHRPGTEQRTGPTERPHVAIVPLPFVGRQHSDGSALGIAVILPAEIDGPDRAAVLRALGKWRNDKGEFALQLGRSGVVGLTLANQADSQLQQTLWRRSWCRPASRYVSVTPVALDRFPGDLYARNAGRQQRAEAEAIESIQQSCVYAGLPHPKSVEICLDTPLLGVRHLRSFRPYRTPSGTTKMIVHVRLDFGQRVTGPVLIGAGRYFGYGLCWPLRDRAGDD